MLSEPMLVSTLALTDLERAERFFSEQLALPILDETPFAICYGASKGTRFSVRRGQPNVGYMVGHFEVDDIEASVRDLPSRGITFDEHETPKTSAASPRSVRLAGPGSRIRTVIFRPARRAGA